MAFRAVAAATTDQAVVAININDIITLRAPMLSAIDGNTQSPLQHGDIKLWRHMVAGVFCWDRM
jgi:hypothetical protein